MGEIHFSQGTGRLLDQEAIFVVTENAAGGKLTIRPGSAQKKAKKKRRK